MKKIKFYLLFILVLSIAVSCKSDDKDDKPPTSEELIVGVWKPIKDVEEYPSDIIDTSVFSECEQTGSMTFGENGYFQMIAKYGTGTGSDCHTDSSFEATWSIENGNLLISDGSGNETFTYFKVKNNILKLGEYDDYECVGSWYYMELARIE